MRDDVAKAITVVSNLLENATEAPEWQAPQVTAEDRANLEHVLGVLQSIDPEPEPVQELRPAGAHHSRPAGEETPWPSEPPEAHLVWMDDVHRWGDQDVDGIGYLHWYDVHGDRAAVPVTRSASVSDLGGLGHVWHVEEPGDGTVVVSPSIHFIGFWHSPNPVTFRLVDELTEP